MSQNANRNYRATVILNTRGYDEPVETLIEKFEGTLKDLGAESVESDNLGRMDFARVTDRHHTGDTFLEVRFAAAPGVPEELHEKVRLDRQIKRLLVQNA